MIGFVLGFITGVSLVLLYAAYDARRYAKHQRALFDAEVDRVLNGVNKGP